MKSLMKIKPLAIVIALGISSGAFAQPQLPIQPQLTNRVELISEAQIAQWLSNDPAIRRAQAQKQGLHAEAAQTANSGYEWTASYQRQEREYEQPELAGVDKSREWNIELERSFRLPGKGAISRRQADALHNLADATEQAGLRNAVGELIDAYLNALQASASLDLLERELAFAQTNLKAVEHRIKAGDAPALDARLAAAESQALERELQALTQEAINRWTTFRLRYPTATLPAFVQALAQETSIEQQTRTTSTAQFDGTLLDAPALKAIPEPQPLGGDLPHWQERLLNSQPELQQATASLNATSAAADKARRDRIPDPSIAVFSARESFGEESIVGVRLSMPIPGSQRSQAMRQRYAEASVARAEKEILQRSLRAQAENLYHQTHSEFHRWQLAKKMADNLGENARLLQKAYRLGEQDLQGLLLGQQQHARAVLAEVESRVDALRSLYHLRLAAGELNPFAAVVPTTTSVTAPTTAPTSLNSLTTADHSVGSLQ